MAETITDVILLETKRWGKLEIEEDEIISFKCGVPGFEHLQSFAIFDSDEIKPFRWLISVDDPDLGFIVVDPHLVCPDFQPKLFESDLLELDVASTDEVALFVIITLTSDPLKSTVNLRGPLLINKNKKAGKQIVVVDDKYSIKYPILQSVNNDCGNMN